ncbi:hypothetical protein AX15_002731 [Amanita polypyramis BW_CC]|nr:hypothetical protein AX15_002731 [Amanita polypyramis BW_CC]
MECKDRDFVRPFLWLWMVVLAFVERIIPEWSFGRAGTAIPRINLPAAPEHFFGRDEFLDDMVGNITNGVHNGPRHMALQGGILTGKSAIARMFVNRVEIARAFGRSRHWIRCQSIPNVEAMLHALATSLSLSTGSNDPLEDIISHLQFNPSSLLIVLDDFQMPDNLSEIEVLKEALGRLGQFSNVCILLTTRDLPLPEGVGWLHLLTKPLSIGAAVTTFKSISGCSDDSDDEVQELVHALGCVPFSISIIARQRQLGFRPTELLQQLRSGESTELGRIDDVVQMSLASKRFTSNPGALTLLVVLAQLPKGAHYDNLAKIAPCIKNPIKELKVLLASGHASRETDAFIPVQAPTRSYLSRHHQLEPHYLYDLRAYYFQLCDGGHELGTKEFQRSSKALITEGENVRAVLLDALDREPTTKALSAVVGFANFLCLDIPNVDVTKKALEVIKNNPLLAMNGILPHCWFSHGKLLLRLDKYHEALDALKEAEDIWQKTGKNADLGQVYFLYGKINCLLSRRDRASEHYEKAFKYFDMAADHIGGAMTLQGMAILSFHAGNLEVALEQLEHAKQLCHGHGPTITSITFTNAWVLRYKDASNATSLLREAHGAYVEYGCRFRATSCVYQMGIALSSSRNYDEAEECLLRAYREFDELDSYGQVGYTLHHLVEMETQRHNFDQAFQYNGEAHALFDKIKNYTEIAKCHISRARIFAKLQRMSEAEEAHNKAKEIAMQHCSDSRLLQEIAQEPHRLGQDWIGQRLFPC